VTIMAERPLEVIAIDHIYLTVSDLERSERYYDPIMRLLDFRKGTKAIAGEPHVHYFNRVTQISLRGAHQPIGRHDPYAPGLHHLCLQLSDREAVDRAVASLAALGVAASAPRLYPVYAPDYYATFFEDPDGIRLELVALRHMRKLVRERWNELDEFVDPLSKKGFV